MQSKFCFHCLLTTGLGRLAKVAITLGWRISCLCAHCKGVRHVFRFVQCGRAVKQHHEHERGSLWQWVLTGTTHHEHFTVLFWLLELPLRQMFCCF